jgi:RNase adaptor protein for sRNA GlmZ degradation
VILLIQLKQQDKLLQKIEQLKKQKEEGAREIRDLHAQKEILVKRQEEIRRLDLQKKIHIEKMSEKDKKVCN